MANSLKSPSFHAKLFLTTILEGDNYENWNNWLWQCWQSSCKAF